METVTVSQVSAILILIFMSIQLIALLYGGFLFFSKLGNVIEDVEGIKKEVTELPTFAQHYRITSEANTQAIVDILQVVKAIPNLEQRMLTAEQYMRENGTLKTDINVIAERTGNLIKLLESIDRQICLINERQWKSLERENLEQGKVI